jgi:hypothetical protein
MARLSGLAHPVPSMRRITTVAALAAFAILAGAPVASSSGGGHANKSYGSIRELRAAVEHAGLDCADFRRILHPTYAAEQAACSHSAVIQIFATQQDKQDNIYAFKGSSMVLLVGSNWIVSAPRAALLKLQPTLGGVLRRA